MGDRKWKDRGNEGKEMKEDREGKMEPALPMKKSFPHPCLANTN